MSDYGLEIQGESGQTQVTSYVENLVRVHKEEVTVTIPKNNYGFGSAYVPFPYEINTTALPIIMLRAESGDLGFGRVGGSSEAWSGFYVTTSTRNSSREITFTYEAYAAGSFAAQRPSDGYGMQMFDESGALIFDSEYPPLAVVGNGSYTFNFESDMDDGQPVFELKKGDNIYISSDELLDTSLLSFVGTQIGRNGGFNTTGIGYGGSVSLGYKFFLVPQSDGGNRTEFQQYWKRVFQSGSSGTPSRSDVHKTGSYLPPLVVQNGEDRDTTTTYIKCWGRP